MGVPVRFSNISTRVITLVLAVLVLFTVSLGVVAYRITSDWLENTAVSRLEALASARQTTLDTLLREYRQSISHVTEPDLAGEVKGLLDAEGPEKEELTRRLTSGLRRKIACCRCVEAALILDRSKNIVAATAPDLYGPDSVSESAFLSGMMRTVLSDPTPAGDHVDIEIGSPLRSSDGDSIAILLLRINGREILSVTGDYTGLGRTGETVLGVRRGELIHFLAPLRFDPNLSAVEPAPVGGGRAKPMIHATAGQSGSVRAPDYRDVRVIAAYRPSAESDWGIVVKQDEAEAFESVVRIRTGLLIGLSVLLLVSGLVIVPLAKTLTRPIRDLQRATRRVAQGDLETRVEETQSDEVGELAASFNTMVDRLSRAHADLEASNKELSSFAYIVSHDLKAPLRAIANLAEWLDEDLGDTLSADQREQMDLIRNRVARMNGLINGLLEYSRIGRVNHPVGPVSSAALVDAAILSVAPPETMKVVVQSGLPEVEADEIRLGQIFQNLLHNAARYHPGPEGTIEVGCRDAGDEWVFFVRDDGAGIDPTHHERVFEIFQTLQPRDRIESTGIGLSIVNRIVDEAGGRVWIESTGEAGSGTTVLFTWPKKKES